MTTWDGDQYQARFDALAASGKHVHGEADFVSAFAPAAVLDAGCGTGRVAVELASRGIDVVGVDRDPSMLATARTASDRVAWVEADLAGIELGRTFDVVVMAGNVMLFTADRAATVAACARHLSPGGLLVAGFSLGGGSTPGGHTLPPYDLAAYDEACADTGLVLAERFATWERDPFTDGDYAVSVHRRE